MTHYDEIEELRQELRRHDEKKPRPILARTAVMMEPTIPALLDCLANRSRSVAVITAEGGNFLNGHAMKAETAGGTLATYNEAWDGRAVGNERRSVDSVRVDNPRLTLSVSTQPHVMEQWKRGNSGLGRGSGFQSRPLFAYPESTQGTRKFREAGAMPKLDSFHARNRQLLDVPLTYDAPESQTLAPPTLSFSPEAKAEWVTFHNDVEADLGPGGDVADAKDVASKAAENAARLAAIFHVFECGPAGTIGADHVRAAARIVTWHLYEALRYFTIAAPSPVITNAAKLEAWLVRRTRETGELQVKTAVVLHEGPGAIRLRPELNAALDELRRRYRVRTVKDGRTELIELNPAILEAA